MWIFGLFFVLFALLVDWRLNKIVKEAERTRKLLEESLVRLGEIVGESRQGRKSTDRLLDAVTGK